MRIGMRCGSCLSWRLFLRKNAEFIDGRRGRYIERNKGSVFGSFGREASTFSMVVEGRAFSEKEEVRMLYFMDREQAQHLISAICGLPQAGSGAMDEIAISAFREVLSQCLETSVTELRNFLARDMQQELGRAYLSDSAGSMVKTPGMWQEGSILMLEYRITLEGVGEFTLFCAASMLLFNLFGMEYKAQKAAGGGRSPAIPVRSVSFPEFRYMSLEDTVDEIGEDRGRIRDMSLDVSVRIGETVCKVRDILELKPGQMIVLDKQAARLPMWW